MRIEEQQRRSNERARSFEDTPIWKKAHGLVIAVYELSSHFPQEEKFSLISQVRRSVISIEANIAEAFGRYHYNDKLNFYYNSRGSLEETKSHLITARDLGYLKLGDWENLNRVAGDMKEGLNKIIAALRRCAS